MPICPEHAASTSPVPGSLVACQPPPFLARIVWDDQSSVSNHQEDPKCKPVEHGNGLVRGRCGADGQRRTDDDCEQCMSDRSGCPVRERISSLVTNSDQWTLRSRLRHQMSSASIFFDNITVTDHVSAPYGNIGRIHVL